jgi:hypothetical protein
MLRLDKALHAWGSPDFKTILKQEIESMDAEQLPLQRGLTTGNYVIDNQHTAMINSISEVENHIYVTAGIFYKSVIGGCSCADDPTPVNENNEYCVVRVDIDKTTAVANVSLVLE